MQITRKLLLLGSIIFVTGCGDWLHTPLPFPTPAQHDLIVLTSPGVLSYVTDEEGTKSGLEHDLVEAFALELGVAVKYIVVPPEQIAPKLAAGQAHLAAAWLSPSTGTNLKSTPPLATTHDLLVQHEASLPLSEKAELSGRTVHVMAGSRQAVTMQRLSREIPELKIIEEKSSDLITLLEAVGNRQVELAVIDSGMEDIANQFVPSMRATLTLSDEQPIVWLLGQNPNSELQARTGEFIERAQRDGTMARLEDRYFGHARRLNQADIVKFLGQIETTLPKLRKMFQAAQTVSGIDWRLIAAVAYQESHWDSNATSPTGVRGIMMLTEETADRLNVSNRLDPKESIPAGAKYINLLKDALPHETKEPDRTWLALAAYNIGPGHFNAARTIAKQLGADPLAWYEMKRILPLLAKPKYYERLKSGRARGGEAVILVENIRSYYDILVRHESPYQSATAHMEKLGTSEGNGGLGLKLKRQ